MKFNEPERAMFPFLLSAVVMIFILLVVNGVGLYPSVMSDEYLSSMFSRVLPLSEIARRPGYIYSAIYRVTNIFGDGFLEGARILNALFFVSAMPLIYSVAKQVCTRRVAAVVAVLALLGPINTYTAYFMPESLYFLFFWVFTWLVLRQERRSSMTSWGLIGLLMGVWSLVKPHALFLLPSGMLCIMFFSIDNGRKWIGRALLNAVFFVACVFLAKFAVSYVLAGKTSLTLFGTEYSAIPGSEPMGVERMLELILLVSENISGHVLGLCLLFGMPVAVMLSSLGSAVSSEKLIANGKPVFYTAVVLSNLVLVTVLFSAKIAGIGAESITRLHMRYYNFTFPLLLIIAASPICLDVDIKRRWKVVALLLIGLATGCAIFTQMNPFTPSLIDCPELRSFTSNPVVFYTLGGLSFLALAVWFFAPKPGAKLYLYFILPVTIWLSFFRAHNDLQWRLKPDVFDRAGIFARQNLTGEEISRLLVVGPNPGDCMRVLFYLDHPDADWLAMDEGSPYCMNSTDSRALVLLAGDYPVIGASLFELTARGFKLVSSEPLPGLKWSAGIPSRVAVNFRQEFESELDQVCGLSGVEPSWGTWSDSKQVVLEFSSPLPAKFRIYLEAAAFGPSAGKQTTVSVGSCVKTVVLDSEQKTVMADFENSEHSSILVFDIPDSSSPWEMGLGDDQRKLGIRFVQLHIVPLD